MASSEGRCQCLHSIKLIGQEERFHNSSNMDPVVQLLPMDSHLCISSLHLDILLLNNRDLGCQWTRDL